MLLSAVSVLVVAQSSSEIPKGLMNNPVFQITAALLSHVNQCCMTTLYTTADILSNGSIVRIKWESLL